MRNFLAVMAASLAAALLPALPITFLFAVLDGDNPNPVWPLVLLVATIVSLAHTLLLGLVAAGWLLRAGKFRVLPMLITGFVIGVGPAAIWEHPWKQVGAQASSWIDGVKTVDSGVLTLAGWIDYFQFIGCAGALGALGAVAFYYVYMGMTPNSSSKPNQFRNAD